MNQGRIIYLEAFGFSAICIGAVVLKTWACPTIGQSDPIGWCTLLALLFFMFCWSTAHLSEEK